MLHFFQQPYLQPAAVNTASCTYDKYAHSIIYYCQDQLLFVQLFIF